MSAFESEDAYAGVEVRRFAVKYTPPTIVIEYKKDSKLYIKKIKLKINTKSDAARIVHKLIKQNSDLLHHDKICKDQLTELVTLLIEITNAAEPEEVVAETNTQTACPPTINTSFDSASDSAPPTGDANKPAPSSSQSPANIGSGSSGPDTVATRRGTDEDDPLDDQEFNSLILSLSPTNFDGLGSQTRTVMYTPANPNTNANTAPTSVPSRLGKVDSRGRVLNEEALLDDIEGTAGTSNSSYAVVDLNKAPQLVVDKVKEHMTLQFSTNQLKPGDEGYIYDVQKDFTVAPGEAEENDWDEDEE